MKNLDNYKELTKIAYEAKNWSDCYLYSSKIIENNPNDSQMWYYKGVSSGYLAEPTEKKLDEMIVYLDKYIKNSDTVDKKYLAFEIMNIVKIYLEKYINRVGNERHEKKKEASYFGESLLLKDALQTANLALSKGEIYTSCVDSMLDVLIFLNNLHFETKLYSDSVDILIRFLRHSKWNGNYIDKSIISKINRLKEQYENKLQITQPNYVSKNDNCYIVTATLEDLDHPWLFDFRYYRDSILSHNIFGRQFIKLYYLFSPLLAKYIKKSNLFKSISINFILTPIHKIIRKKIYK
jgi:hypothetical protein